MIRAEESPNQLKPMTRNPNFLDIYRSRNTQRPWVEILARTVEELKVLVLEAGLRDLTLEGSCLLAAATHCHQMPGGLFLAYPLLLSG